MLLRLFNLNIRSSSHVSAVRSYFLTHVLATKSILPWCTGHCFMWKDLQMSKCQVQKKRTVRGCVGASECGDDLMRERKWRLSDLCSYVFLRVLTCIRKVMFAKGWVSFSVCFICWCDKKKFEENENGRLLKSWEKTSRIKIRGWQQINVRKFCLLACCTMLQFFLIFHNSIKKKKRTLFKISLVLLIYNVSFDIINKHWFYTLNILHSRMKYI